ncbi:MAG: MazG nucleotide pyrophosphohydrolase domain-containing protein [Candidatus Nucleicultricaceae bacterium]
MKNIIDQSLAILNLAEDQGFVWPSLDLLFDNVKDEVREIKEAFLQNESHDRLVEETGDLIFGTLEICRNLDIDPREALAVAFQKFQRRFEIMLEIARSMQQHNLKGLSDHERLELWKQAKERHAKELPS